MYNDKFIKKPKTTQTCIACGAHLSVGEPRYSTYQEGDSWYWCVSCFDEASKLKTTGNGDGQDYLSALKKSRNETEE